MISPLVKFKRRLRRKFSRTRWVARLLSRDVAVPHGDEPGLVILQIDGLSRTQFENAVKRGRLPFLRSLMKRGHFDELSFYSGLPSTTPAVQAEVMFGAPTAVPAFQFLNRRTGRTRLMYELEAAKETAAGLTAEHQPLLEGGRSYSNIYAAGAAEARLCAETMDLKTLRQMARPWKLAVVLALYFPTIIRIAALAVLELFIALTDVAKGLIAREHWRAELHAVTSRVGVSIVMREWLRIMVKLSIEEGAPIIHANFLGYDEQAHRRGPGSAFAHWVLKGIDDVIRDVFRTAVKSDVRDYEVVIFSDHGQERTQIYDVEQGRSIQEAAQLAFGSGTLAGRNVRGLDNYGRRGPETNERARRLLRISRGRIDPDQASAEELANDVIVTALGPLGHIYLPVKLSDQERAHYARNLVEKQRVPLALYRDEADVVRAYNRMGAWTLPGDAEAVFGPGHPFLKEAPHDLVQLCQHPNAGDIVISGWSPTEQPVTFVHENGAHGSIGSEETRGVALVPHGLGVRRRRGGDGEVYIRPRDLYRAAWRFVHPDRKLTHPRHSPQVVDAESKSADHHESALEAASSLNGHPRPGLRPVRVMTYNVHSCIGIDGKIRPERIVSVIRSSRADVIALQEVDAHRRRSKKHEQARMIAEALSMSHHYFAISDWDGEQYGLAIISRFPLEHVQSGHLTPADVRRRGEARGALWVKIETPAGPVHVINTHFGLRREERLRQTDVLLSADWIGGIPADEPVVLCGDLNAGPKSPVCRTLGSKLLDAVACTREFGPQATFISTMPLRRLDHVFVSRHFTVRGVMQPRSPTARLASDHLPVCIDLSLEPTGALQAASAPGARR